MNYTYPTPSEAGYNLTQGVDKYFAWIVSVQPSFISYFLVMIWVVIFMGGSFADKKLTNRNEFTKWALLSSIITLGIALLLSFQFSAVGTGTIFITIALVVITGILYFMSK